MLNIRRRYLRPQKEYIPHQNVTEIVSKICLSVLGNVDDEKHALSPESKFKILVACFKEFNHGVPNSVLHDIESIDDIIKFYVTPVDVTLPLDRMKSLELPRNLHILHEYHRFHPDTDMKFGGISAFPKSSTIVTGLKYKKKYPGYKAQTSWP